MARKLERDMGSFDVTVEHVIGTIELGDGDTPAVEAAFGMIARHAEDGIYHFPGPNGGLLHVMVKGWLSPEQEKDAQEWRDGVLA